MVRSLGILLILMGLPAASSGRQAATFRVLDVVPAPGAVLAAVPAEILVTMSDVVAPHSVDVSTVRLVGDGPDDAFDSGDDLPIVPASVAVVGGAQIRLDLTGVALPNDTYRVTLLGDVPIQAGRVAWWKFDESAGTTVKDSSGAGNHGTIGGAPVWFPGGGRIGGALGFGGGADVVRVPRGASLEPAGSLSVSLWARITSVSGSFTDILRKADGGSPGYLVRWYHFDDRLQWRLDRNANPSIYAADTQVTTPYLNGWHHIAGTYDGAAGTSSLYVDGVLKSSVTGFTGALEHTDDLFLMWSNDGGQIALPGRLDDVRIYSRALTVPEIQSLAAGVSDEAVTDLFGAPVDGNFGGTFPSGDGTAGGHFVSTFTLNANLPPAPTALRAAPGASGSVELSWTDPAVNETGFSVERSADGITFVPIGSVAADVVAFQDPSPPGTSFYRVRALNGFGGSGYSNVASATPGAVLTNIFIKNRCGLLGLELLPLLFLRRRSRLGKNLRA